MEIGRLVPGKERRWLGAADVAVAGASTAAGFLQLI